MVLERETLRGETKLPSPHKGGCCRFGGAEEAGRGNSLPSKKGGKEHCRGFFSPEAAGGGGERWPSLICHLLSLGRWSPWECRALPPSLEKCRQAACSSLPAGQRGTLLHHAGRGNGAGDVSGPPHTPTHPLPLPTHPGSLNPLDQTTSAHPRAAFRGSPVPVRQFLGQAPGVGGCAPPPPPPPLLTWGKLAGFGPRLPKAGQGL